MSSIGGIKKVAIGMLLAGLAGAALLIMNEVDSLLRTLEHGDSRSYGMAALTGLRFDPESESKAIELWLKAAEQSQAEPMQWIKAHTIADMVFALIYGLFLVVLARRVIAWQPPLYHVAAQRTLRVLPWVVLGADLLENAATWLLAHRAAKGQSLTSVVYLFSAVKWLALLLLGLGLAAAWVRHRRLRATSTGDEDLVGQTWGAVLWTFRVQIGVVALLAFVVAVPSQDRLGALQQLPDVLRSYADNGLPLGWLALSGLALLALVAAVWMSGYWLNTTIPAPAQSTTGYPEEPQLPSRYETAYTVLFILGIAYLVLAAVGWFGLRPDDQPWVGGFGMGVAPLLVGLLLLLLFVMHRVSGYRAIWSPAAWGERHHGVLAVVAVLVITIAGLGLVRAFAGPWLVIESADGVRSAQVERDFGDATLWLGLGLLTAVFIAPAAMLATPWLRSRQEKLPGRVKVGASVLMLLGAITIIVLLGGWPERFAPPLGINGVLALALAVGCLFAGGLVAVSRRSSPFLVFAGEGPDRDRSVALPSILIIALILTTLGFADPIGTYHSARTLAGDRSRDGQDLASAYVTWEVKTRDCAVTERGQRIRPMVFIAAAGGGIRAAYWTEQALLALTGPQQGAQSHCSRDGVFLVSSVSGGSLGSALWSLPDSQTSRAKDIADRSALAAISAAWLFRDWPRSLLGVDTGWEDRAAVMTNVWESKAPGLSGRFINPPATGRWDPVLLFNGTDLLTGCRVVVSRLAPPDNAALPDRCDDPDSDKARELPGAYYVSEFLDTPDCDSQSGDIKLSTAALLSARFPYITPTGTMYACADGADQASLIQIGDGGYLENSGVQGVLQSWRAVQSQVTQHNESGADAVIVPIFVIIGNGYRATADPTPPGRQRESIAPIAGLFIPKEALSGARMEAELRREAPASVCDEHLVIAPSSRPEVSAPLGWSLSDFSTNSLDEQLELLETRMACVKRLLTPTP